MKRTLLSITGIILCTTVMLAQWSNDPAENNRITPTSINSLYDTDFKVNKDGITYVLFLTPAAGVTETKIQILDKNGVKILPEEGMSISRERTWTWTAINYLLMTDNDGNAIVIVSDCRNSTPEEESLSYTVYKISPTGEMLWGENGVDLERGIAHDLEAHIQMIPLEDGSYAFAWMRTYGDHFCIELQRVSSDGELLWEDVILKDDNSTHSYPYLVNAGYNQMILVYAKGSNQDIYARKIDFDGSSVWSEDTRVYRGGFGSIPLWTFLRVAPDNNGGVFIGWNDDRLFTQVESTYVSYVKSNGELGFTAGEEGQKVGYSELRSFYPEMMYDEKEECVFVIWRETSASQTYQRIAMQKISLTGELLWDPEGIEIQPIDDLSIGYYSIQKGPDGQIAVFYMTEESYTNIKSYAALVNTTNGNFIWEDEHLLFSTAENLRSDLLSSQLIDGKYWLTIWKEERSTENGKDEGAYMQLINSDGTLNMPTSIEYTHSDKDNNFTVFPSVVNESAMFIVNHSGYIDISIFSIDGRKITTVFNGYSHGNNQQINWNAKSANTESGMYIAVLTTSEERKSTRIIIKK